MLCFVTKFTNRWLGLYNRNWRSKEDEEKKISKWSNYA